MRRVLVGFQHLLAELKRRKVYQVAVLYCVGAFGVLQLADIVLPTLGAADRAMVVVLVLVVAGFPAALLLGWMYDWTEGGVRRAGRSEAAESGSGHAPSPVVRGMAMVAAVAATLLVSVGGWKVLDLDRSRDLIAADAEDIPDMDPRRIAVLYFDDYSPDGSLGYLAAGITESLLHELGSVPGLAVSSRNAVKLFRDRPVPHDSMVEVLRVGSLIEGSVTRSGDAVRATVQLIDGASGSHVDSRIVEGSLDRIFAFQDSVATTVARALRQRLGRQVRLEGAREGASVQEAWLAYLRAQELVRTLDDLDRDRDRNAPPTYARADSMLADAERLDPDWAAPSLFRIEVAYRMASTLGPRPGALDSAWAAESIARADRLLSREPGSARALALRGRTRLRLAATGDADRHLAAAERDLARATRLDPDDPEAWWTLGEVLVLQTRFNEAVHAARTALEADVFLEVERSALQALFNATLQLGPGEEAVRWCDEARRRFPREINFLRCRLLILGTFPDVEPDAAEALTLMDSIVRLAGPRSERTWRMFAGAHVAQVLARAGMADSALAVLRAVRGDSTPALLGSHEAKVHLLLGDEAEAVRLLRHYLTVDPDTAFLAVDWWFEDLHDFPPFRRLVGLDAGEG